MKTKAKKPATEGKVQEKPGSMERKKARNKFLLIFIHLWRWQFNLPKRKSRKIIAACTADTDTDRDGDRDTEIQRYRYRTNEPKGRWGEIIPAAARLVIDRIISTFMARMYGLDN